MKLSRKTPAALALLAAVALTLAGCSGSSDASVIGTTWGDTAAKDTPSLTFNDDGSLNGTDGCNVIGGDWTQTDNTIEFGALISTMMFCEGIDDWLGQSDTAVVDGNTMVFSDKDGNEIGTLTKDAY